MKTYVITISKNFPTTHKCKGQPTFFFPKIVAGVKKHTIRGNYDLWKKRIDEVNAGIAVLSLREWSGKPYASKQTKLREYGKGELGIQKISMTYLGWFIDDVDSDVETMTIAENDGLTFEQFKDWFRKVVVNEDMAIIHFTNYFRY